jgi:hypothetical protein
MRGFMRPDPAFDGKIVDVTASAIAVDKRTPVTAVPTRDLG